MIIKVLKNEMNSMTRTPAFLTNKEVPNEQLLNTIKKMVKDGKTPKKMKRELTDVSLYIITRYYSKIRRGVW